MTEHRPDTSIRLSTWTTAAQMRLLGRICKKWDVFQAEVLRYTLEAMVPLAAAHGMASILSEHEIADLESPYAKKRPEQFPMKMTVRTSVAVRADIARLMRRKEYSQAEILRYSFAAGLPLALAKGLSHIMKLREAHLASAKKNYSR